MTICLIMGIALPLNGYAAKLKDITVDAKFASGYTQGQMDGTLIVSLENTTAGSISGTMTIDPGSLPSGVKGLLPSESVSFQLSGKEKKEYSWNVDLEGAILGEWYTFNAKVAWGEVTIYDTATLIVEPSIVDNKGKPNLPVVLGNEAYNVTSKLEVISPKGGLNAGVTNMMELKITNNGNTRFSNVYASITPGEKMSLSNAPVEQRIGNIEKGASQSVTFPLFVESSHPGGNIPITFNVKGTDPSGKEATFTITEYVTVNAGSSLADRLNIINIQNPSSVAVDQNFNLKFSVQNNSAQAAKNIKVTVEPTAPIVNRTKNIFVVDLAAGESKAFDVQMFAVGGGEMQSQNYPIKITAETTGTDASSVVQYTGVFVDAGSSSKTVPQIIITNYTYGDSAVIANQAFPLSLVLKNTNTSQTLKNIKVSLTAEEGIFIPHNTSNSFYIDKIGPGASINKTIELMTKPDAPEKTVSITVDMSYEDSKGNPVTVKDTISVPVVQERRLVIDDIVPTDIFFVGEAANISVQYYNMGKNTLNNLVISAEGDFDFPQSTKMFVGKLDAGKNDFYDFQFIPLTAGESSGKVIFTFEDSAGKQIVVEKAFKIVAEEMVPIDPSEEIVEPQSPGILRYVIGGVVLIAVIGGVLIYRKRRSKKINSLDIDSE